MSDQEFPLPPATFEFLVLSLKTQTEVHLGLLHFGEENDRSEPNFPIARHSIDLLAMLQEKTRGNLQPGRTAAGRKCADRTAIPVRAGHGAASKAEGAEPDAAAAATESKEQAGA